jgi:hypothetical protein
MRRFWSVLGLSTSLVTLHFIGFPNQRANEAQAHCRAWHPHHCTIQEVVDDVGKTVDRWGLAAVSPKLIPVSGYLEFLLQQGNGRWQRLPDDFKTCYREHYGFNLDDVRFATNVNTIHGQGITVDTQIYFPRDINLSDRSDRHWMLHELEHVRQYQVVGGVSAFLVKYAVQGGIEVGRNGSINIHDNIRLEREADSKADRILDACSKTVVSLNLALDANNGSGNLYLYPNLDPTNNNHLWTITPLSDGYFMITSKRNGYALDANGGTGNLYLHPNPDTKNPNHHWRLTQVGGFYMITSRVNGYALDANGGTRNLYLHPNPDRGNSNHLWKIVDVGSYKAIGSALKN